MELICSGLGPKFSWMAREQDAIGWRGFMEGMISTSMRGIQHDFHHRQGTCMSPVRWAKGLIRKLLEVMHGQWIYRNIQIHNEVFGTQVTLRKESIQREIEEQMKLGEAGLLEEDHWMLEVDLGDMENTNGKQEEYWLLAIKAARVAARLAGVQNQTTW